MNRRLRRIIPEPHKPKAPKFKALNAEQQAKVDAAAKVIKGRIATAVRK